VDAFKTKYHLVSNLGFSSLEYLLATGKYLNFGFHEPFNTKRLFKLNKTNDTLFMKYENIRNKIKQLTEQNFDNEEYRKKMKEKFIMEYILFSQLENIRFVDNSADKMYGVLKKEIEKAKLKYIN
jgi:hypothetical protein